MQLWSKRLVENIIINIVIIITIIVIVVAVVVTVVLRRGYHYYCVLFFLYGYFCFKYYGWVFIIRADIMMNTVG